MIEFEQVSKRYPNGQEAISDLSVSFSAGELAFLTGHSGAGKSTLLKMLMLMERPTSGQVLVAGQNLGRMKPGDIPHYRRRMGVVFQNHQLLFDRSVYDNVALPLHICGFQPRDIGRRVRAALDKVGLLSKEKQNPEMLSSGEQQRVGIARAVVHKPRILLADEPTGNLDPELSAEIMALFNEFCGVGVTVIVATHNIALVAGMGLRRVALQGGRLVSDELATTEPGGALSVVSEEVPTAGLEPTVDLEEVPVLTNVPIAKTTDAHLSGEGDGHTSPAGQQQGEGSRHDH